jgi:protoheme IX farnesyltransferase
MKDYYRLTKPGVLYGNVLTVVAGFLFAAQGKIDFSLLVWATVGMTLVIASACAWNNYLDQDIDARMTRTKKRPSVTGKISDTNMVLFASALGVLGLAALFFYTNTLVVLVAIIGFIDYVVLYGMLSKRMSVHGTLVGSISGAIPILAGYVAASGVFDVGAVLVFLVLFLWQMPEFYSIAIYRRDEYKAAGVPVMTVVKGVRETILQIFAYTFAFVVSTLLLTAFGYAGVTYLVIMGLLGGYWLWHGFKGLHISHANEWARKMFRFSLIILLAFCLVISVDAYLP